MDSFNFHELYTPLNIPNAYRYVKRRASSVIDDSTEFYIES